MSALPVFAFDVIAVTVLTYGVYYRRHRRQDMALAFIGLNVGVMAVATVLSNSSVGAGLGLGLFSAPTSAVWSSSDSTSSVT
jgi:hypothetical protein